MSREQFSLTRNAIALQDSSPCAGQSGSTRVVKEEALNGTDHQPETGACYTKKLQDDLQVMELKIKQHEQNIKNLKSERNRLDDEILDMQVVLGKDLSHARSEEEVVKQILKHEKSAAGIFCQLTTRHGSQASNLPVTKDVLGIVATLGKVGDDNLSWLLSEYLGLETMLAVVCKTSDGVKALETSDKKGIINTSSGIHGIGASIGRHLDGRFQVICLESLRPYAGEFITDDPQKRLDLLKPRLPNEETPAGFLGFAVNMIILDGANLSYVSSIGHGLRETLFYDLFSCLQIYKTKEDMLQALPCISTGAISLDGGIMKRSGVFSLGRRVDTNVKFPKHSGRSTFPENHSVTENRLKELKWKKEIVVEDLLRELELLDRTRFKFETKEQELVIQTSSTVTQMDSQNYTYSNMTSGEVNDNESYEFDPPIDTTEQYEVPLTFEMGCRRGGGFKTEEDIQLCRSWVAITREPINKRITKQWERIFQHFDTHRPSPTKRTMLSLKNRWQLIKESLSKFSGCYSNIHYNNGSLTTEEDKMNFAKSLYKETYQGPFAYEHCWYELRDQPKFNTLGNAVNNLKQPKVSSTSGTYSQGIPPPMTLENEDEASLANDNDVKSPTGSNSTEEKARRGKNKASSDDLYSCGGTAKLQKTNLETRQVRIEHFARDLEERSLSQESKEQQGEECHHDFEFEGKKRLRRSEFEEKERQRLSEQSELVAEREIMRIDTTKMDPVLAEYWKIQQRAILKRYQQDE